jgi:hypothetical protein
MTESTALQLVEAHGPTPENPIRVLEDLYKEKCGKDIINMSDKEAIGEYYRVIENRGLPAFQWMSEVFNVISKKSPQKRNIRYAIGIIRSWLKFGFGHIPSEEERDILDYFEELLGTEASPEAVAMIQTMLGRYGCVKVTRMIAQLEDKKDISMLAFVSVMLDDKYK